MVDLFYQLYYNIYRIWKGGELMEAYKRIKQYIEENGLKQTYVAEKAGIGIGIFMRIGAE